MSKSRHDEKLLSGTLGPGGRGGGGPRLELILLTIVFVELSLLLYFQLSKQKGLDKGITL